MNVLRILFWILLVEVLGQFEVRNNYILTGKQKNVWDEYCLSLLRTWFAVILKRTVQATSMR